MGRIRKNAREKIEQQIIKKVWDDPKYKQKICSHPQSVFQDEFSVEVPDDITIFIHQETVNEIHIVLPLHEED